MVLGYDPWHAIGSADPRLLVDDTPSGHQIAINCGTFSKSSGRNGSRGGRGLLELGISAMGENL